MQHRLILLAIGLLLRGPGPARADDLAGPLMGYLADPSGRWFRAIRGLPGSATMGDEIRVEGESTSVTLSPAQNAALLWSGSSLRLATLLPAADPEIAALSLPEGAAPSLAAFSPGGTNLAVFDNAAATLYLLPLADGRPGTLRTMGFPMPGAPLAAVAVGDGTDPLIAGITAADPPVAFVADLSGNYRALTDFNRPSAVTFVGGSRDLVFADSGARTVFRVADPLSGAAPELIPIDGLGDGLRIASSPGGKTLLVLDGSRTVRSVDLKSGTVSALECDCAPGTGQAMRGRSVFRLTDAIDQPVWILDAGWSEPRLVFVPAAPAEVAAP